MNTECRERLASHVKRLRGKRSHRQFAPLVGVAPSTLSGWENGKYTPTLENFERLAELASLLPEVFLANIYGRELSTQQSQPVSFIIHSLDNSELPEVLFVVANRLKAELQS